MAKMKPCPTCGKDVSKAAAACPSCGHAFKKRTSVGTLGCLVLIIIVVGIGIAGVSGRKSDSDSSSREGGATQNAGVSALPVSARQLFDDYDANEVSADRKYKGAILSVTGTVQSIDKDFLDNVVVRLETTNQFMGVNAYLLESEIDSAGALKKGQSVSLTCKGEGRVAGSPVLRECVLR